MAAYSKPSKFWVNQPCTRKNAVKREKQEIAQEVDSKHEVSSIPGELPGAGSFVWSKFDVGNPLQVKELFELLANEYVEDEDSVFRFLYSEATLKWALMPPGWNPDWHVGVRAAVSGRLVAFISAIPVTVRTGSQETPMAEVNFLCVHHKIRGHGLTPLLISEVRRRVNVTGIWQAVFTAGVRLPVDIFTKAKYYHRSLNVKKLVDIGFQHLTPRLTLQRSIKLNAVSSEPALVGWRAMQPADVSRVTKILHDYLDRFDIAPIFSEEEVEHWFVPRHDVVSSYVVETEGCVTDFASFYHLPSSVRGCSKHSILNSAYCFYMAACTVSATQLIADMLVMAKKLDYDVFNMLDVMQNEESVKALNFHVGTGDLHYYFFNWHMKEVESASNAMVLL